MNDASTMTITRPTDRELLIERSFDAPRDLVWSAFTEPERLAHWWGPAGWTLPHCTLDLRVGGRWHYCMRGPGGEESWGLATYEEIDAPATQRWIAAQNELTAQYLGEIPARPRIHRRLTELWNYERYGLPFERGGRYFLSRNDGLQNQSVLYWMAGRDSEPQVLLDPNQLSDDGTVALMGYAASEDGRLLAYGLSAAGSDWMEWRVREVESGRDLDDLPPKPRPCPPAARPDGQRHPRMIGFPADCCRIAHPRFLLFRTARRLDGQPRRAPLPARPSRGTRAQKAPGRRCAVKFRQSPRFVLKE